MTVKAGGTPGQPAFLFRSFDAADQADGPASARIGLDWVFLARASVAASSQAASEVVESLEKQILAASHGTQLIPLIAGTMGTVLLEASEEFATTVWVAAEGAATVIRGASGFAFEAFSAAPHRYRRELDGLAEPYAATALEAIASLPAKSWWIDIPEELAEYELRDSIEVVSYVMARPDVRSVLAEIPRRVGPVFGAEAKLALELVPDPETGEDHLVVWIRTQRDVSEASALLTQLDNQWWTEVARTSSEDVSLVLEYR